LITAGKAKRTEQLNDEDKAYIADRQGVQKPVSAPPIKPSDSGAAIEDYESFNIAKLHATLEARKLEYGSRDSKGQLIALLKADDEKKGAA
jgi:hypothetical protein